MHDQVNMITVPKDDESIVVSFKASFLFFFFFFEKSVIFLNCEFNIAKSIWFGLNSTVSKSIDSPKFKRKSFCQ